MAIDILHFNDLPVCGCSGLKEQRLIMSPKLFGQYVNPGTWAGIGDVVYLADACLGPNDEISMHSHKDIDLISIMAEGSIVHYGSLGYGQEISAGSVQIQRAGVEGFSHNETNPNDTNNRMVQIWVLPNQKDESAAYKLYQLASNKVTRIYGGNIDQTDVFPSNTCIDCALLAESETFTLDKNFIAYLALGRGCADNMDIEEGSLFKGEGLNFEAKSDVLLVVIYEDKT